MPKFLGHQPLNSDVPHYDRGTVSPSFIRLPISGALGADIAELNAALAEDGNRAVVVRVGLLEAQLDRVARRTEHALHTPVALALILVREVDADNGRG